MSSKASRMARSITAMAVSCAAALVAAPSVVRADPLLHCGGQTMKWESAPLIWRNPSIAETEPVISAFMNGINQWTAISNFDVRGPLGKPPEDDNIALLDFENEVGIVPRDALDGLPGTTHQIRDICVGFVSFPSDEYQIHTKDIWISEEMAVPNSTRTDPEPPFGPGPGNNPWLHGNVGRTIFLHEFGHFFGARHAEGHDVMRATPLEPISGGVEPAVVWPSDTSQWALMYGIQDLPNLSVSSTGIVQETTPVTVFDPQVGEVTYDGVVAVYVSMLDSPRKEPPQDISMCAGSSGKARFYIGNSSKTAIEGYDLELRLSPTPPPAGSMDPNTVVTVGTHALGPMEEGYFDLPFTVPTNLPPGLSPYFIHLHVDPRNVLAERDENDNTAASSLAITIRECGPE